MLQDRMGCYRTGWDFTRQNGMLQAIMECYKTGCYKTGWDVTGQDVTILTGWGRMLKSMMGSYKT